MTCKSVLKAAWLTLVSILLTSVTCFGDVSPISRQAYVVAAYEEFHSLLYFLSGDHRFLQNLTPEERAQFEFVGNSVVRHVVRLGPAALPGQDRTSMRVDFKLKFSDRVEDFILNPGEPQRTAKMAGDIWFNLNVINNPKVSFGLLDAFQILFHEFGHKIGEKKNQNLIDSVAAKIRLHLASYYKETVLNSKTKVSSLVVPYITFDRNPVDYQFEPIVIVDHQGQAASARFEVMLTRRTATGFFVYNSGSQAYARQVLTPKFSLEGNDLRIDWRISTRHSLVVADRFNYLNLFTNLEKVKADEKIEPFIEYQKLIQVVPQEQLQRIANKEYISAPLPLKGINSEYQPYTPANEKSRWLEKLRMSAQTNDRVEYSTVIESQTPVKTALLLAERDTYFYKFKGEVTHLTGNIYRLSFSLPAISAHDGFLDMYSIAINGRERWDLEEVVKMPLKKRIEPRSAIPSQIAVMGGTNGQNQWHVIQQIQEPLLETEEVRWRFSFKNTKTKIETIEIMWMALEQISKDGRRVGDRAKNIFEVIDAKDMRQTWVDGSLVVEILAKEASKVIPSQITPDGFEIKDSLARAMVEIQITDQNYNTTRTGTRLVNTGWKSGFTLNPKSDPASNLCKNIFR
ncbi:hypothetical protein D3C87_126130 [compost metagenome]